MQVKASLTGAAFLAPQTFRHPKRALVKVNLMEQILNKLDQNDPLDVVVTFSFSMIFYSVACTGEFTLPSLNAFDPT